MGTTIRIRRRCFILSAAALTLAASSLAQAQYPAYEQPYAPPQQQAQAAYRPGQTTSAPVSAAAVSRYAAPYPGRSQTSAQIAGPQTPANPQYRVASTLSPTAAGGYSVPHGQTAMSARQDNATATTTADVSQPSGDRYSAPYGQSNATAQPTPTAASASNGFVTPGTPQYTAMAYGNNTYPSAQSQDLSLSSRTALPSPPGETSVSLNGATTGDDSYDAAEWNGTTPAADGNLQTGAGACATGDCNYGLGANSGGYSTYDCYYGTGGYGKHGPSGGRVMHGTGCNRWFGGVYGLLMERDGNPVVDLAFASAGLAAGDFPSSSDVVLSTRNVDLGYQGGVEFRLGRTLGGYYDPSGGSSAPSMGLEGVYWTLFTESDYDQYVDGLTLRTYSMIDLRGLEFDPDGAGALPYRPASHYFDYAPPVNDNTVGATLDDIEVRIARVRSQFEVHNVELNLLQLAGLNGCSGGCDVGGGATCDTGACATGGASGSRFSCGKFAGFRFLRLDESFMYGVDFENTTTNATGFINHNIRSENDLYGVQIGCNNLYRIGYKWGIHCNAMFGLYGNDIDVRQNMSMPVGGNVRFVQTADNFDVRANKSDVSTIGEVRLGASYQYTAQCRFYGGWRLLGVTGVALATDQIPSAFIDPAQVARVDSSGSVLLHGLQAGVEFGF